MLTGLIVVSAFVAAGGFLFMSGPARIVRKLRAAPATAIGTADEDAIVRVTGKVVQLDEPVEGPLSGRPCVYYQIVIDEQAISRRPDVHLYEERGVRFLLDDGTGRVVVDPSGGKIALALDTQRDKGVGDTLGEREQALLERVCEQNGEAATTLGGVPRAWMIREGVIELGERISVIGRLRAGDARELIGQDARFVVAHDPKAPLYVSDEVK